jgi:endoglucanase
MLYMPRIPRSPTRISIKRVRLMMATILISLIVGASTFAAANDDITVAGSSLLLNGRSWIARGVTIAGFSAPYAVTTQNYRVGHDRFGPALLKRAAEFGADLIRFEVSQPGLNPNSVIYSTTYLDDTMSAIGLARSQGFLVIISMKWFKASGLNNQPNMPSDSTARAWDSIIAKVADDPGILLELFNEPGLYVQTPGGWSIWAQTMQSLIDHVRAAGARNVLIIDGLGWAHDLTGAPPLADALSKLVYGIHPYLEKGNRTPAEWEARFGRFAETHPVIVSEWNASSWSNYCYPDMPEGATELLNYLHQKRLGIVVWTFDLNDIVLADGTLSNFTNFECGPHKWNGIGQMISDYFRSQP